MKIRQPAVAGIFYPSQAKGVRALAQQCLDREKDKIDYSLAQKRIIGGIVPHAGYIYSGYQAVHFYQIIKLCPHTFDTVIVLCPNHCGYGKGDVNVDDNQYWQTPLGRVEVDTDFVRELNIPLYGVAHEREHSAEVQIPFLQIFLEKSFQIVPIVFNCQSFQVAHSVAQDIYKANSKLKRELLLVASSDFSHYVSPQKGEQMDNLVLHNILNLDSRGVDTVVRQHHLSVCGYGPIMALMEYSLLVSDECRVEVLQKGHSGQISYSDSVVDYISILFMER